MKVLCTLPNAADQIAGLNGLVAFEPHDMGRVSEDVSQEEADFFCAVPGYEVFVEGSASEPSPAELEHAALLARAKELGITTHGNWKLARLRDEVKKAEAIEAAAEAKPE